MFRATTVFDAGDNLLPRIAPLIETYCIDQIEVESLWNESLAVFISDTRIAGPYFKQNPLVEIAMADAGRREFPYCDRCR